MDEKEKVMICKFLEEASERFGDHICNDVPEEMWKGWSILERRDFVREYHEWNGDPEEYDPNFLHLPDFAMMSFLRHKLNQEIGRK